MEAAQDLLRAIAPGLAFLAAANLAMTIVRRLLSRLR